MTDADQPRISLLGTDAVLFDVGGALFNEIVQQKVWAVCDELLALDWVREAAPGMNNFTVVYDDRRTEPGNITETLTALWSRATPKAGTGRVVDAPTIYGGETGDELAALAERTGLSVEDTVRLHAGATYSVAVVGAMPGFVYLSGLDSRLAWGRHATPRPNAPEGSVMIGATQAGIMPCAAPTGWHIIGLTALKLFDASRPEPATLRPGDQLRFVIEDIRA